MKKILMVILCVVLMMCASAAALAEGESAAGMVVDLTGVIVSLAVLVFDVILGWVATNYLPSLKAWLDERTTESQRKLLYDLIEKLVKAAEQVIGAGKGSEKLEYVIDGLRARGVQVDVDLIEAAVKEMNEKALKAAGETLGTAE